MAHPKALNDTPDTAQPGQPQTRNPTTPGDLPHSKSIEEVEEK